MGSEKQRLKLVRWVISILFLITWIIIGPVMTVRNTHKRRAQYANQIETIYGDISFSGRVVDFHYVKHSGMPSAAIMCIKLDSSNVDSFYHFDQYTALKIENGIVTLPIGTCHQDDIGPTYEKVVYVNVNDNFSRKMLFINKEGDTIVEQLYYSSVDLKEYDLGICDSCNRREY